MFDSAISKYVSEFGTVFAIRLFVIVVLFVMSKSFSPLTSAVRFEDLLELARDLLVVLTNSEIERSDFDRLPARIFRDDVAPPGAFPCGVDPHFLLNFF